MIVTILTKVWPLLKKSWLPLLGVVAGLAVGHVMWSQQHEITEAKKEVAAEASKNAELEGRLREVTVAKITGPDIREKKRTIQAPDGTITIEEEKHTTGGTKDIKKTKDVEIKYLEKEVIKYVEKIVVKTEKPLPPPPMPKWEESLIIGAPALDLKANNLILGAQVTRRFDVPFLGDVKVGVQAQVPVDDWKSPSVFLVVGKSH